MICRLRFGLRGGKRGHSRQELSSALMARWPMLAPVANSPKWIRNNEMPGCRALGTALALCTSVVDL
jgi:hypothetical protein